MKWCRITFMNKDLVLIDSFIWFFKCMFALEFFSRLSKCAFWDLSLLAQQYFLSLPHHFLCVCVSSGGGDHVPAHVPLWARLPGHVRLAEAESHRGASPQKLHITLKLLTNCLEEVLLRKLLPVIRPLLKEVRRPAFSKFLLRSLSSPRCGPTFLHGATEFSGNRILRRTSFATLTVWCQLIHLIK